MRKTSYNGSQSEMANRTMTVTPNVKFQNVERLNTIVGQVTQRNKQTAIRSVRTGMSDKVLDLIKHRIKSNYDKLYQNYDDNKKTILKQIQHVETNMAGENTVSKGFQNVIKEKSHFDKTKAELELKQKKLKKMTEIRDQLKLSANQHSSFEDVLNEKYSLLQDLDSYSKSLDYQTSILNSMKTDRRSIKLTLKERYDKMMKEEQLKKERMVKLENGNHTKHTMLMRIEESLKKEDQCEIPENLAEELERKLEEYQGKHTYENIIKHENQISEENKRLEEEQAFRYKEEAKRIKIAKEKEELKEYQMAYNFYLIKQQEEEKIKKICGVSSLGEIANNNLQSDFESLGLIKGQISNQTQRVKMENQQIKKDTQEILERGTENFSEESLQTAERQCIEAEKELRKYTNHWESKSGLFNEWHSLIQTMNANHGNVKKQKIGDVFRQILDRIKEGGKHSQSNIESYQNIDRLSLPQTMNTKFKKMRQQYQSECSILQNDMI